jgi:hypothetical protein
MVLYGLIVLGSDIFLRMTVAARHVRVIAPFGAWTIGTALAWTFGQAKWGKPVAIICSTLIAAAAVVNFSAPLIQIFPRNFPEAAGAAISSDRAAGDGLQPLRLLNDGFLHNPAWNLLTPPNAKILWSTPHPFAYVPYLFEGYDETRRAAYLQRERSMKVLRFDGVTPIRGYPYAFKLSFSPKLEDPSDVGNPILCSGSAGAGDVIFLIYHGMNTAQVGIDHWGSPARISHLFPFERGVEHTLIVIAPCLVGDAVNNPISRRRIGRWSHRVYVSVDGATVMNITADFYHSNEYSITVGLNLIHATSAQKSMELTAARFSPLQDADWFRAEAGH